MIKIAVTAMQVSVDANRTVQHRLNHYLGSLFESGRWHYSSACPKAFVSLPTGLSGNNPIHRLPFQPPQALERDGSNRAVLALVGQDTL